MRPKLMVVAAVMVALVMSGCGSKTVGAAGSAHTITGTLTVMNQSIEQCLPNVNGSPARLSGGYSDIGEGTGVAVSDQGGTTVGTGSLDDLQAVNKRGQFGGIFTKADCQFSFSISGVPDESFYAIEASHRGEVTFSAQDMQSDGWHVALTLG